MHDISFSTFLGSNYCLEVYCLCHVCIIRVSINAIGVLLDFLFDQRFFVLFFDCYIGICCIKRAERTKCSVYEVVTKVKTGKFNCSVVSCLGSLVCNAICCCVFFCKFCKSCCISSFNPSYIALCIEREVCSLCFQPRLPSGICFVSIGTGVGIVAFKIKQLIDGVCFTNNSIVDSDAAISSSKCGCTHSKEHDYNKKN